MNFNTILSFIYFWTLVVYYLFFASALIFSVWYVYWKNTKNKRLIDRIPGFKDWPLVGDVLHRPRKPSEFLNWVMQLCNKNRDKKIVKLKVLEIPRMLVFSADVVEQLTNNSINIDKSPEYSVLHRWLGFGLLTSSGSKWRARRKMLTPGFHFSILKDYLTLVNEHARALTSKLLEDVCGTDQPFDIQEYLTLSTIDMICDTAMGVNVDALHGGQSEYVSAILCIKEKTFQRTRNPLLLFDWVYRLTATGRAVNSAIDVSQRFTDEVIKERREAKQSMIGHGGKHKPFLDLLLDCKDEEGQPLTDKDIREEVDTFMFEGHDTTATTLGFTLYLLSRNADVQRKCQQEIDEVIDDPSKDITTADLSKLTYLECCIKEAMRMYPTVPFIGRKLSEDTKLGDYVVPKGTSVSVCIYALHKDPEVFPDPERFDPERFTQKNCLERHPFAYMPFSAGPRNCIGQKFAMMEMKVVMATLLRTFNIVSEQTHKELGLRSSIVLQASNGINVKLHSRV